MEDSYSDSVNSRKRHCGHRRHSPRKTNALEAFFKVNPYPDEKELYELGRQVGLEQRQVVFWFQNRRSQRKVKIEKADNNSLRAENDRFRSENVSMRAALQNALCVSCGVKAPTPEERQKNIEMLQRENENIKEQIERLSLVLASGHSRPRAAPGPRFSKVGTSALGGSSSDVGLGFGSGSLISNNNALLGRGMAEMERILMSEAATSALKEFISLISTDEPLWIKSAANHRSIINREAYDDLFPRAYPFKGRVESSRETRRVCMPARQLVEIFLDAGKWVDFLPTIVSKSRTIQVLKTGSVAALHLMYEQIHFLSPFMPPQELTLLRKCEQIECGVWIIVDVSYDLTKDNTCAPLIRKRPSGCIIRDLPRGFSEVTWIQHMEVGDKRQTDHYLLQCNTAPRYSSFALGAERCLVTLEMMSERFACWLDERAANHEVVGVIDSAGARIGIMNLARSMVKNFFETLNTPANLDLSELSDVNNGEFKISVCENKEPGLDSSFNISGTTSLWLPLLPQTVFNFFLDEKKRDQWDALCNGNPVRKIGHISNGNRPGNCISISEARIPGDNDGVILQETCTDPMGWLVVYAPFATPVIDFALKGEDTSMITVLPSGFVITAEDRTNPTTAGPSTSSNITAGSLLVMAFQISVNQVSLDSLTALKTLISSTVEAIRFSFSC